jgi:tRNA threonylcarbamoyladenosine biosynthesis protein TsaE
MSSPPFSVLLSSAAATRELGRRLAELLRAGDVVILSGELGAGKTTFVQGVGAGLGVRGAVTSPTFVISRVHPATLGRPALVHVDAYRLGGEADLDDLDLDAYTDRAVTLVEWGDGLAEALSPDRLRVHFARDVLGDDDRRVTVTPTGSRWIGVPLQAKLEPAAMRPVADDAAGIGRSGAAEQAR